MKGFVSAIIASIAVAQTAPIHVNSEMRMLADADGRAIIFHGVNVVYKVDPYIPSDGDFDPDNSLNI